MNKSQPKRLVHIDVVAGIMIVWMIFAHCRHFSSTSLPFPNYLSFFMPWFFYKSGMFFKKRGYIELMKRDANKFLRYYIVYSMIGWILWSICGSVDHSLQLGDCFSKPFSSFVHDGSIRGNGALWFLLSLYLVRQLGNFIIINFENSFFILIVSLICFTSAYVLNILGWHDHSWWLGNHFSGLCYFLIGYLLKNKEQEKIVFLFSTFFYLLVLCLYYIGKIGFPFLYMHANKMHSGSYILFFPMALAGIVMINNIFFILCKHIKFRILEYVGNNALNFYVTHWILLIIISFIAKYMFHIEKPSMLLYILMTGSIIFLPLINIFINSLKAKYSTFNKIL